MPDMFWEAAGLTSKRNYCGFFCTTTQVKLLCYYNRNGCKLAQCRDQSAALYFCQGQIHQAACSKFYTLCRIFSNFLHTKCKMLSSFCRHLGNINISMTTANKINGGNWLDMLRDQWVCMCMCHFWNLRKHESAHSRSSNETRIKMGIPHAGHVR